MVMKQLNRLSKFIVQFLAPTSLDASLAARQHVLNLTLSAVAVLGLAAGLVSALAVLLAGLPWTPGMVWGLAAFLVGVTGLLLSRAERVQSAAFLPSLFLLLLSIGLTLRLGIGHFTILLYPLTMLIAAVLLNTRAAVVAAVISLLAHLVIGDLQGAGLLDVLPGPAETFWIDFLGLSLANAAFLGFIFLFRGQSRRMITDTQARNQALESEVEALTGAVEKSEADLDRRLLQIRTAAEITSKVQGVLDQEQLIDQMVSLVRDRFGLYYVGVFLLDPRQEYAVLRAGTGDAGQKMVADGHKLAVGGDSMIGWCIANRQARIALDVGQDPVRFNNPYLWRTRSELALPILHRDTILGAVTVQSDQGAAFDEDDILLLQGIADNLASALQNAQLFSQVQSSLQEIQGMHRQYLARAWGEVQRGSEGQLSYTFDQPTLPDSRSTIEVPLVLRDEVIGRLLLDTDQPTLSSEEKKLVDAVVNQAALALENARLLHESQRRAYEEQVISEIAATAQSSLNLETVMKATVEELGRVLQVSRVQIRLATRATAGKPGADAPAPPNGNGSHSENGAK
jgi:GAF domain-containing protein